jgi:hypothetical protein
MSGVFPRTRLIPAGALIPGALILGGLALLSACGEPPAPRLTSPPRATPSAPPISIDPSLLPTLAGQTLPTQAGYPTGGAYPTPVYPTYPAYPAYPTLTTTPAATVSPTPTPSHAPKCTGSPTAAEIITLIKGQPGVPNRPLQVHDGPRCSGVWSFATVEVKGETEDQLEPLMVVATGKTSTLTLVAAGSEVCVSRVRTEAPPGIRVLACGF